MRHSRHWALSGCVTEVSHVVPQVRCQPDTYVTAVSHIVPQVPRRVQGAAPHKTKQKRRCGHW